MANVLGQPVLINSVPPRKKIGPQYKTEIETSQI